MQAGRASKAQQGKTTGVHSAAHGRQPDTFCHVRIDNTMHALGCFHGFETKFAAEFGKHILRRVAVQLEAWRVQWPGRSAGVVTGEIRGEGW